MPLVHCLPIGWFYTKSLPGNKDQFHILLGAQVALRVRYKRPVLTPHSLPRRAFPRRTSISQTILFPFHREWYGFSFRARFNYPTTTHSSEFVLKRATCDRQVTSKSRSVIGKSVHKMAVAWFTHKMGTASMAHTNIRTHS